MSGMRHTSSIATAGLLTSWMLVFATACASCVRHQGPVPEGLGRGFEGRDETCPDGTSLREVVYPASGSIRGTTHRWCKRSDGTRHGPSAAWWDNGARQHQGRYDEGLEAGTWRRWDHDDVLYQTEQYHRGELLSVDGEPVEMGELYDLE